MDDRATRALDLMEQALVLLDEVGEYAAAAQLKSAVDKLTGRRAPISPIDLSDGGSSMH